MSEKLKLIILFFSFPLILFFVKDAYAATANHPVFATISYVNQLTFDFQDKLNSFQSKINQFNESLLSQGELLNDFGQEIIIYSSEIEELFGKLNEVGGVINGISEDIVEILERLDTLEGKLNDILDTIGLLEDQGEKVNQLEIEIELLKSKINELEGRLDELPLPVSPSPSQDPTQSPSPTASPTTTPTQTPYSTEEPTPTPIPTLTPTPTSTSSVVVFEDNFDGESLNLSEWEVFDNRGTYSVSDGFLNLPGGTGIPFIKLRNNYFPTDGSFEVDFSMQYTNINPAGVGLGLSYENQQNSYTPSNIAIAYWQDLGGQLSIKVEGIQVHGFGGYDTDIHNVKIRFEGNNYQVYFDGPLSYTSTSSSRSSSLWLGNQNIITSALWTGFKIDYIKITDL